MGLGIGRLGGDGLFTWGLFYFWKERGVGDGMNRGGGKGNVDVRYLANNTGRRMFHFASPPFFFRVREREREKLQPGNDS